MSKIIKPKLNPDGSPVIDFVRFNDWYFSNIFDELLQWKIEHQSSDSKMPIYYAEEWRPKKSETYFYYHLQKERAFETKMYNDDTDTYNLKFENYFQTLQEATEVSNILKVIDNMKKYYEEKLKGGADETLHI